MTFFIGGQGKEFNNVGQPNLISRTGISFENAIPSKNIGQSNKPSETNSTSSVSVAYNKGDQHQGVFSDFQRPPPFQPSNLSKTIAQVETGVSSAMLSAGIFSAVMGGPAGLGIGLASSAVGAVGLIASPYVQGAVEQVEKVFHNITF